MERYNRDMPGAPDGDRLYELSEFFGIRRCLRICPVRTGPDYYLASVGAAVMDRKRVLRGRFESQGRTYSEFYGTAWSHNHVGREFIHSVISRISRIRITAPIPISSS